MPACTEIVEKIKIKSPVAISGIIECVEAYFKEGVDGFETEINVFGKCCGSEDFKEGVSDFMEKRKAGFPGK